MSGTSLDGLDLAYCRIWQESETWKFEIKETKSIAYSKEMQDKLKNSIFLTPDGLLIFHNTYGTWLGEQAKTFVEENRS